MLLPLKRAQQDDVTDSKDGAAKAPPDFSNKHVLVAEDNAINQLVIESMLAATQATVTIAENGQMAVALFRKYTPDIVLMDIHMPVLDGIKASHEIKLEYPAATIVAFSADALDDTVAHLLKNGFDSYLPKPVKIDVLYNQMNCLL